MSVPLLVLALAGFSVGTTEFIIAGILPEIAGDLGVSIPTAGYLISGYAFGVVFGGPIVSIATTRFERKSTLIGLMGVFVLGNIFCALAPSYGWLMGARVFVSLMHGALTGFAIIAATMLVTEDRRARAISLVLAGLVGANVIGVPIGTAIGNAYGWRVSFWAIAALGLVALAGMALWLPRLPHAGANAPSIRDELGVLARQEVYLSLAMIMLAALAYFGLFSYVAPLLIDTAGLSPLSLPWLLSLFGVGAVIGMLAGGRLADWKLMPSVICIFIVQAGLYVVLPFVADNLVLVTITLTVWSIVGIPLVAAPLQARILNGARDAPNLASTLISSAFNIGIGAGAALGALALTGGFTYGQLPWISLAAILPTLLLAVLALSLDRRRTVAPAAGAA